MRKHVMHDRGRRSLCALRRYPVSTVHGDRRVPNERRAPPTVAIRHQMSTLKHNIRHQQAQLAALENTVLRGPRPLPPGIFNSPPMSPSELDSNPPPSRVARRSSFEALQGLAGPDSGLPLPRKSSNMSFGDENGIREGIPTGSGAANRSSSPTRTLSRESSLRSPHPYAAILRPGQASLSPR